MAGRASVCSLASLLALVLAGSGARAVPPRGVVLVLLDTVRADHLSTYGYTRQTSPALERLAARGIVFDQAVSYASWTLPSTVALLSGSWADRVYAPEERALSLSLVDSFQAAGFRTAAFTEGGYVSRHFGLARGFDTFEEVEGPVRFETADTGPRVAPGNPIATTFDAARAWLGALGENERFFLLLHTYEPHAPYTSRRFVGDQTNDRIGDRFELETVAALQRGDLVLDAADRVYLTALYDGDLWETDRHLGRLLDFLGQSDLARETVVVVTSDHGEELGAHYPANSGDHGHSLRDDLLRVPLVIAAPEGATTPRRVPDQVRTVDVLPTIAELLEVTLPEGLAGRSLAPLLRGGTLPPALAYGGSGTKVGPRRSYVRYLGFKYIEITGPVGRPMSPRPPFAQLYDLGADPNELHNLVTSRPALADRYERWLMERFRGRSADDLASPTADLPGALRERLRSLGYLE